MLGFYACRECSTVYAEPEAPPSCRRCGSEALDSITDRLQSAPYFWPDTDRGGQ